MKHPDPFLKVLFHTPSTFGDNLALCAGFERGAWRCEQFADHVMEWLPEFALNYSEVAEIGYSNAVKMTKKAARLVYQTEKYGRRGEFGELLLHIAIRQVYETLPAVSKIFYKSSTNETVKGFDAVHVVKSTIGLELWIGETKFYTDVNRAIVDVSKEIIDHFATDYLRTEFILIGNKIDPTWPEAEKLKKLLDENVSLDEVFEKACIPVLLTYESSAVNGSTADDIVYTQALKAEVERAFDRMRQTLEEDYRKEFQSSVPVIVHVILVPLKNKVEFAAALDSRLKALQQ